jgi:hypothetical protein
MNVVDDEEEEEEEEDIQIRSSSAYKLNAVASG